VIEALENTECSDYINHGDSEELQPQLEPGGSSNFPFTHQHTLVQNCVIVFDEVFLLLISSDGGRTLNGFSYKADDGTFRCVYQLSHLYS